MTVIHPHFAIVGYDNKESNYGNIGTGFFLNDAGAFLTTAHTFRNTERISFAVLEMNFIYFLNPN